VQQFQLLIAPAVIAPICCVDIQKPADFPFSWKDSLHGIKSGCLKSLISLVGKAIHPTKYCEQHEAEEDKGRQNQKELLLPL
jgi:hypothetical protein